MEQNARDKLDCQSKQICDNNFVSELKKTVMVPQKIIKLDEEKRDCKNSKEFTTGQMTSSFKNRDSQCSTNEIQVP